MTLPRVVEQPLNLPGRIDPARVHVAHDARDVHQPDRDLSVAVALQDMVATIMAEK